MNQSAINTTRIPLDTLWNLFQSQPKSVRIAFVKRLQKEENSTLSFVKKTRKAKVLSRVSRYSDEELEKLLSDNSSITSIPKADVHSIVSGGKGKTLANLKHWL